MATLHPGSTRRPKRRDAAANCLLLLLTVGLLRVGFESRIIPQSPHRTEGHSISSEPDSLRLSTPEERHTLAVSLTSVALVLAEPVLISLLAPVPASPAPRDHSGLRSCGLRAPPIPLS